MASKSEIKIISRLPSEFGSNITVDNVTYHVQTEDMGKKTYKLVSRVYLKGEVVFSKEAEYSHIAKIKDPGDKIRAFMEDHHKAVIGMFLKDRAVKQKSKSEYFEEVRQLLRKRNSKSALKTLRYALENFPSDPFFLSYYGCLLAIVENKPKEGIRICKDAIGSLKNSVPFGSEFFYPVFYLNLGRAYLKDDNRDGAVTAFKEGLKNDPEDHDLLWEMKKLGLRKRPVIPFLRRGNPINRYIGMLLSRVAR